MISIKGSKLIINIIEQGLLICIFACCLNDYLNYRSLEANPSIFINDSDVEQWIRQGQITYGFTILSIILCFLKFLVRLVITVIYAIYYFRRYKLQGFGQKIIDLDFYDYNANIYFYKITYRNRLIVNRRDSKQEALQYNQLDHSHLNINILDQKGNPAYSLDRTHELRVYEPQQIYTYLNNSIKQLASTP